MLTRAEITALLALCPIDLPLIDEHGVTRDGEPIDLGPAGHGTLPNGDRVTARLSREPTGLRIAWQFIGPRPGREFRVGPPPYGQIARWLHGREIVGGHRIRAEPADRPFLRTMLQTTPPGITLRYADLIRGVPRPGANMVVISRVDPRADVVAASYALAHTLHAHFMAAA
jgi:hypothetical protein